MNLNYLLVIIHYRFVQNPNSLHKIQNSMLTYQPIKCPLMNFTKEYISGGDLLLFSIRKQRKKEKTKTN